MSNQISDRTARAHDAREATHPSASSAAAEYWAGVARERIAAGLARYRARQAELDRRADERERANREAERKRRRSQTRWAGSDENTPAHAPRGAVDATNPPPCSPATPDA